MINYLINVNINRNKGSSEPEFDLPYLDLDMPPKYSNFVTEREKRKIEERLKKKNKNKVDSPSRELKKFIKESDLVI